MQNSSMNFRNSISSPAQILVVDDHPHTAALLARALSQLGPQVNVVSATSGQQALECAEKDAVDILITDMNMPGMTGLELIEQLQQRPEGGPVVSFLISAGHAPGMRLESHRLQIREVLYKPIHPQRMRELVREALQEIEQRGSYEELEIPKKFFKILIADDQPDHVTMLSRFMEGEGYACTTAQNGLEALERIFTDRPDLILLDVNMPGRDGFSVLQEIRTDPVTQHIPAIFLSASWDNTMELLYEGWKLEPDDFFTKPIQHRELLARIRTKLQAKEPKQTSIARENN
jgi:two-component system, sensor histidine kinase and response regulator